jgi:hypothetical protein
VDSKNNTIMLARPHYEKIRVREDVTIRIKIKKVNSFCTDAISYRGGSERCHAFNSATLLPRTFSLHSIPCVVHFHCGNEQAAGETEFAIEHSSKYAREDLVD